eukprot:CAMPEP_0115244004 /NCGR_PEP_ID=MMETSP0270-20121206/39764_1 /TAXON_ID=71861 /ORGANISM="Scrippsiella trochoidea, Strain CCMP3099" /LENGTH=110 /DNA_ID=CAMNT_0002659127 /DNA_START=286 /DNA_END=618 /DNA_ORIENTATION=+
MSLLNTVTSLASTLSAAREFALQHWPKSEGQKLEDKVCAQAGEPREPCERSTSTLLSLVPRPAPSCKVHSAAIALTLGFCDEEQAPVLRASIFLVTAPIFVFGIVLASTL